MTTADDLKRWGCKDWSDDERRYMLGMFYLLRGDFDEAIGQYQQLVDHADEHYSERASAHLWLAMALLHAEVKQQTITQAALMNALQSSAHTPEAIAELEKTLKEDPDFYPAHNILAVIYRYQGDNKMADFHAGKAQDILQNHKGPAQ